MDRALSVSKENKRIVITNRKMVEGTLLHQLQKISRFHPYAIILRETDLPDAEYEALAQETLRLCMQENIHCFLHSRIDIALKIGCRNIHLPLSLFKKRAFADEKQPGKETMRSSFEQISVSCHSMGDMQIAVKGGATQVVLGTIFATESKKGVTGRGLNFLRKICDACPLPVYAIGGITPENLASVCNAGAAGGCMMSGFMKLK